MSTLESLVRILEADLEAMGWDEPARLYAIEGPDDDPHLVKITEFEDHPYEVLSWLVENAPPLPKRSKGLLLAMEAYAWEPSRELVADMVEKMKSLGVPDHLQEATIERAIDHVRNQFGSIREMPGSVETRIVDCVMRDGRTIAAKRNRGEAEPEIVPGMEFKGRVNDALRQLLTKGQT